MRTAALILVLAAPLPGEEKPRVENPGLLGIVVLQEGTRLVVGHVLEDSPAAKAGIAKGDRIEAVADAKVWRAADLDAALGKAGPGKTVNLAVQRESGRVNVPVTLVARSEYAGDFLKPCPKGRTGFEAPEWFAYAWANVPEGKEPPTRENTKGKVVVIHAFQCSSLDCRYRGFPVHRKLEAHFQGAEDVVLFHLQTVFEEEERNTPRKGHDMAESFGVMVPVGQDAHVDGAAKSTLMTRFGTGGTPWTIVLDKQGKVAWSGETPEVPDDLAKEIEKLR